MAFGAPVRATKVRFTYLIIICYLDDCLLRDAKYSGGATIQEWTYNDWMQCSDNCRDDNRCAFWIWKQSNQCFTKESYGSIDNEVGVISGPKGCNSGIYCVAKIKLPRKSSDGWYFVIF